MILIEGKYLVMSLILQLVNSTMEIDMVSAQDLTIDIPLMEMSH